MKKIILLAGLALNLFASFDSQAQVKVSVQFGTPVIHQPWYANDNDYYYLPEQGVYYNVRRRVYVYPEGNAWLFADRLPSRYGNYSYRSSQYVKLRDRRPFERDADYRSRYYGRHRGYGRGGRWDNGNRGRDGRWDNNGNRGRDGRWENDNRNDRNDGRGNDNRNDGRGNNDHNRNDNRNDDHRNEDRNRGNNNNNSDNDLRRGR